MAKTDETRAAKKANKKAMEAQRVGLRKFAATMLVKLELRGKKAVKGTPLFDPLRCNQGPLLGKKKDHDIWWYFRRLKGETGELQGAIKRHDIYCNEKTHDAVISEAADVANFAAAVAEKAAEMVR